MVARGFFAVESRQRMEQAVEAAESHTAAEIVVSVQHASSKYRDIDYLVGMVTAIAVLLVLLFHPHPFALWAMPLDVVIGFAFGAALCARTQPLRRALLSRSRRLAEVERSARAAFVTLGVSRTRARTGILVFASVFERLAVVVPDIGVNLNTVDDEWKQVVAVLSDSVARLDFDAFERGVRALGPALSASLPRAADDVNELPNAMDVA